MISMTAYLISAGVLALLVLAVTSVVGGRQMRRVLDEFDAAPGAELVPVALPPVSTLPEVDEDGWSAQRFSPWAEWLHCIKVAANPNTYQQWMDARRATSERAWAARILRDADSSPILAELMAAGPAAIEPAPQRELTGATS